MAAKKKGDEVETATAAETNAETQANPSAETTASEATDGGAEAADAGEPERVEGNGSQPATEFEPSGAPLQVVDDVDPSHPAVDNDPRAATTAEQNRIDFNDPGLSGSDAVKRALDAQSKG